MPIAESPEAIPEDAVDVTKDVTALKDQLHELFQGKDIAIIGMALGSLIGETFDDPDAVRGLLTMISEMAGTVFALSNNPPEGTTIQ
jgi:hypothetical protein